MNRGRARGAKQIRGDRRATAGCYGVPQHGSGGRNVMMGGERCGTDVTGGGETAEYRWWLGCCLWMIESPISRGLRGPRTVTGCTTTPVLVPAIPGKIVAAGPEREGGVPGGGVGRCCVSHHRGGGGEVRGRTRHAHGDIGRSRGLVTVHFNIAAVGARCEGAGWIGGRTVPIRERERLVSAGGHALRSAP